MTTVRSLINKAFRESGVIEAGDSPEAEEFTEALVHIENLYLSLFGAELGENFETINYGLPADGNSYATDRDLSSVISGAFFPSNRRIVFHLSGPQSLYLNPMPRDGSRIAVIDGGGSFSTTPLTLKGNGRKIEGGSSLVLDTDDFRREWFYRADLGEWMKVTGLLAEDESPLPSEFDDFLRTMLAIRINPRYGAETASNTTEVFLRARRALRARYRQSSEQPSEDGLLRTPGTRRYLGTSSTAFDRGY